ncbi:Asp-domain-containing protein [Gyrodon lividus]|nr:Asp-domain-containing protein [Gyrodon lividus]
MFLTLATVIAARLCFVAAALQPAKQRGTAIPLFELPSLVNADQSVNFEALNSQIASSTAKILRGFDNFEKNTGASHPFAVKGARKRDSGGLPLAPLGGRFCRWFGTISIGTPPRNFVVLFDTGSSDTILPGSQCDNTCHGHDLYDPEASLTSTELGQPFDAHFHGGDNAFGYQHTDNVTTAGLTATDQTLGVALHYSQGLQIERFPADGLVGMAFQSLSVFNQRPFFHTLISQGQTDESVFSLSLAAARPELYLGGTNPDMYTGDFAWVPVIQQAHWQVNIDTVTGNGQNVLTNVAGIIDTGTFLIHGAPSDVAALYAAIDSTPLRGNPGFYSLLVPCDAVPSISFTFGGTSFPIPAQALNMGSYGDDPSRCIGSIFGGAVETWIVGNVFLTSVYLAFDVANLRVGFATLAAA